MKIKLWVPLVVKVKKSDVVKAAKECRENFALSATDGVYMQDIIWELYKQGLVEFPDDNAADNYKVDDEWQGPLMESELPR